MGLKRTTAKSNKRHGVTKTGKARGAVTDTKQTNEKHDVHAKRNFTTRQFKEAQANGLMPDQKRPGQQSDVSLLNHASQAVLIASAQKPESRLTAIEKMHASSQGFSKKELEQLKQRTGLDYDQLANLLDVARTTLIGKKGEERFSPGLSEKLMSLADIYSYGYEVFGDQEEFNQWIFQPIPALGGKAPYAFLNSHYGREEVRNIVGRVAYGVYS